MISKSTFVIAAFGLSILAGPAMATCTRPRTETLPNETVILTSPKGKILKRTTGPDGTLALRGLKRGEWNAKLLDEKNSFKMQVTRNGKLSISAILTSYSCSPPGGPVHHAKIKSLAQVNTPAAKSKP